MLLVNVLLILSVLKKSKAEETCKNTCNVEFLDDKKWGIENGEWCIIPESCNEPSCWSKPLGYGCCKGCEISSSDNDGDWGIENGEWCGILPSCSGSSSCWSSALGYPCCEGCNVEYTDNDGEWGFEDDWCGIKSSCKTDTKTSTTSSSTTKKTTTTSTKPTSVPTKKCNCQYEPCGPDTCCSAGLSCVEKDGWSMCEPDPNAELKPATDCEVGPHYEIWCEGCLITDTQTDGSLWGWENKHPCEIKPYECYDFIHADWSNEDHHFPVGTAKGTTTRYWDCCKPSCTWPGKFDYNTNIKICAADGSYLEDNNLVSGCEGGPTYACEEQYPWAIDEYTAYGYAAANIPGETEADWCCTCYALTFTSFPVKGKQMVVQVTNTGGDLGEGHFDLQIPGGGFGLFNGCSPRYPEIPEEDWGDRNGGVISREGCYKLPKGMQEGCLWKFDWFRSADNPDIVYEKVECPQELIDLSGCTRMNP